MALGGTRIYDEDGLPISSTGQENGKRSLDVTPRPESREVLSAQETNDLLHDLLVQMKIANRHLSTITGDEYTENEVEL